MQRFLAIFSLISVTFVVLGGTPSTVAQQPDDVIKTDTSLVQLNIGVVDRQGRAITTLSRNDFVVYEDGAQRPIMSFESTEAPFSLVLLLDMSGSTVPFRQPLKQAAIRFLDALSPDDRVSVIQFGGKGVKSLLGFSTDRKRIAYAITDLADGRGDSPFYEALSYSLKQLAKEEKRRKAIVVLTDGLDTDVRKSDRDILSRAEESAVDKAIQPESNPRVASVLNDADRQGVSIFPLALPSGDPKRLPLPDASINAMYSAARGRMQTLADRTGGRLNEINRLDDLARLYVEVAAYLRTLYSVAYQPVNQDVHDGKWRTIRVEVSRPDLVARAKPGYFKR